MVEADPRVGRLLTATERVIRMEAEISPAITGEVRRTAFAISERHLLTAWHCVRGIHEEPLWFRLRVHDTAKPRHYAYIPVEASSIHEPLDLAVLRLDGGRLGDANLTDGEASAILTGAVISLGTQVGIYEPVRVVGFPMTAPSCDCDVHGCQVQAVAAQLGDVTCLKLFGPSFAAVDPADPHGLSGGPVLGLQPGSAEQPALEVAVGVVRAVPKGPASGPHTSVGGGLVATHMMEAAGVLTEVSDALARSMSTRFSVPRTLDKGFAFIDNLHSQGRLLDNQEYRDLRKEVVLDHIRREQEQQ